MRPPKNGSPISTPSCSRSIEKQRALFRRGLKTPSLSIVSDFSTSWERV